MHLNSQWQPGMAGTVPPVLPPSRPHPPHHYILYTAVTLGPSRVFGAHVPPTHTHSLWTHCPTSTWSGLPILPPHPPLLLTLHISHPHLRSAVPDLWPTSQSKTGPLLQALQWSALFIVLDGPLVTSLPLGPPGRQNASGSVRMFSATITMFGPRQVLNHFLFSEWLLQFTQHRHHLIHELTHPLVAF